MRRLLDSRFAGPMARQLLHEVLALQVSGRGPGVLRGFGLAVDDAGGTLSPQSGAILPCRVGEESGLLSL